MSGAPRVPFVDFRAHVSALRGELDEALARVLDSGWFILGPEGVALERELAGAFGAADAVAVGNGTDALLLGLLALGVGAGDEVVTSAVSAAFTGLAVLASGARPVFVDVDPATLTVDPKAVEASLTARTRAIIPVHLYGHPADMDPILDLARGRGIAVLEDACQAHGARYKGRPVGTLGGERGLGALSFYPTKNLGALGDGGAILVNDPELAARLRQLRNGGQTDRYHHRLAGVNSRLDEMQAAVLRVGLAHLDSWTSRRREIAAFYRRDLVETGLVLPVERPWAEAVWHLFVVRHPRRDRLMAALEREGVGTLIHYPLPLHHQPAFAGPGFAPPSLPVAERVTAEILSLPLYPELSNAQASRVVEVVRDVSREL